MQRDSRTSRTETPTRTRTQIPTAPIRATLYRWSGPLAVLVLLALALPAAAEAPAATTGLPPIVAKSIDFHGGEVYERHESALTLRSRAGASRIETWLDGELFDYTVTAPVQDGERRVRFTNREGANRVYEWREGVPVELAGEAAERAEAWLMARVYFPYLPFRLADPGVYFQDLGTERWGEGELHKVKVTFEPGSSPDADDEYLYWFDPETGRLEQFAYSFHTGNGGLRLRRATDFQRVGGILFSDQENLGVNGPGHTVDQVTPTFAAESMEPVSTVELDEIEVRALGG